MSITKKIINYVQQRYIIKYVDNRYWHLVDNANDKVQTILMDEQFDVFNECYKNVDLAQQKQNDYKIYVFNMHKLSRYIYNIKNCLLDPKYNWVILDNKKLFKYSYPLIEDPWDGIKPRPSVFGYFAKSKKLKLKNGILVKYQWSNYYHFLCDVLPQIFLCDEYNLPSDIPIIVPHNYNAASFVKEYLKHFPLKRKIIVQEIDQYLEVENLYVAKDVFCNNYLERINQQIVEPIRKINPNNKVGNYDKVFIIRKNGIRRSVINQDKLIPIAEKYGFIPIEPGELSWMEQVELFSNAKEIIGIHGAGLTNILFCTHPNTKLFELMPGGGLEPEHYENICIRRKFKYEKMAGDGLDKDNLFDIDATIFEKKIAKFFGQ